MSDRQPARQDHLVARQDDPLSVSDRCELLGNDRRRAALRYLVDRPGTTVRVSDLADHLLDDDPTQDPRNVRLSLRHVHLPMLADRGVVTYDADRGLVQYRARPDLEELLAFVED